MYTILYERKLWDGVIKFFFVHSSKGRHIKQLNWLCLCKAYQIASLQVKVNSPRLWLVK